MTTRVVNLTPHEVTVLADDGTAVVSYTTSGRVARVSTRYRATSQVSPGVDCGLLLYGGAADLPEREPGTMLLVSLLVKLATPARDDLLVVADEVRDGAGRIIGCRALADRVVMERG